MYIYNEHIHINVSPISIQKCSDITLLFIIIIVIKSDPYENQTLERMNCSRDIPNRPDISLFRIKLLKIVIKKLTMLIFIGTLPM